VLEEAGLDSMGTFLAMTSNGEVNLVLAQRAIEEFNPPRVLAVFPGDIQGKSNSKTKVKKAFAPELQLKTWNKYLNDGEVKLGETELREVGFAFQQAHLQALIRSKELLPLLIERQERLDVLPAESTWASGDRIIYLLHAPKPKLLKRLSGANQSRLTVENDDRTYTPADLLPLCHAEGVPLVYDVHHHRCNQDGLSEEEVTTQAIATWDREPMFHISSPIEGWKGPKPERHHDFIAVKDFPVFWRDLDLTVEVEAKAKEVAVLKLKSGIPGRVAESELGVETRGCDQGHVTATEGSTHSIGYTQLDELGGKDERSRS
jgi:hypothetical protein